MGITRKQSLNACERLDAAENDVRTLQREVEVERPATATDCIVSVCRRVAAHHELSDDEHAYLLTWGLLLARTRGLHGRVASGRAANLAVFALNAVPEDDEMWWVCDSIRGLVEGAAEMAGW